MLLPALEAARRAREAGMEVVVAGSMESACGVLAAAHLAAALNGGAGQGQVHGLATSPWLAQDAGQPPVIANGLLRLPELPGLGFLPGEGFD